MRNAEDREKEGAQAALKEKSGAGNSYRGTGRRRWPWLCDRQQGLPPYVWGRDRDGRRRRQALDQVQGRSRETDRQLLREAPEPISRRAVSAKPVAPDCSQTLATRGSCWGG